MKLEQSGTSQRLRLAAGATGVVVGIFTAARGRTASHRARCSARRAFRDGSESRMKPFKEPESPKNLYELFQVDTSSDAGTIKKAYYNLQKVCHPDVAGPEGEEMCVLLNDAYDVLSDEQKRTSYDKQLDDGGAIVKVEDEEAEISTDLEPRWQWSAKANKRKPAYKGRPRSRSKWDRVDEEDRGEKHAKQQFVYVDEFECISCRNCCDVAPHSFCIDADSGRARVYTQWGNSEEYLDYAVSSCPVDCIVWVSRSELQALEHVTANVMFDRADSLPCPMSIRQGVPVGQMFDPFNMANDFKASQQVREARKKKKMLEAAEVEADKWQDRIIKAFEQLSDALRASGWGQAFQKGS